MNGSQLFFVVPQVGRTQLDVCFFFFFLNLVSAGVPQEAAFSWGYNICILGAIGYSTSRFSYRWSLTWSQKTFSLAQASGLETMSVVKSKGASCQNITVATFN